MLLSKTNVLLSLTAGDEIIEEVEPSLKDPLDRDGILKMQELKNLTAYATNYRQFQAELQLTVEHAESLEKQRNEEKSAAAATTAIGTSNPTTTPGVDDAAVDEAWQEVEQTFNNTFKILRYHCIDDSIMFRRAMATTLANSNNASNIEEERRKTKQCAVVLLRSERTRRKVKELRRAWTIYGKQCDLLTERLVAAQRELSEEISFINSHGRTQPNRHDAAASALRCAQVAHEMQSIADEYWDACYKVSVAWYVALGTLGMAKANCVVAPFMPNWLGITRALIEEAVNQGLVDGLDANDVEKDVVGGGEQGGANNNDNGGGGVVVNKDNATTTTTTVLDGVGSNGRMNGKKDSFASDIAAAYAKNNFRPKGEEQDEQGGGGNDVVMHDG